MYVVQSWNKIFGGWGVAFTLSNLLGVCSLDFLFYYYYYFLMGELGWGGGGVRYCW